MGETELNIRLKENSLGKRDSDLMSIEFAKGSLRAICSNDIKDENVLLQKFHEKNFIKHYKKGKSLYNFLKDKKTIFNAEKRKFDFENIINMNNEELCNYIWDLIFDK